MNSIYTFLKHKIYIMLLSCIACFFCGCAASKSLPSDPIVKTGFYFDTIITLTIYDNDKESLLEDCFSLADKYEQLFSASIDSSEVSKINQAGGAPVTVSDETITLLKQGLYYCELSNGGFDLTIGALSSLWNFSENEGILPDEKEISAAAAVTDYHNIIITGNEVQLTDPDARIDLGGIAKGYIADQMKAYLNENGVTSGTINLGGNVLCIGPKSDGTNYRIGIQQPFDEQGAIGAVVEVQDKTVVSSGIYERYFIVDDQIYHHILNPATGYPYENNLLSVSIICDHSVDGDGFSTACFSLGLEEGMKLIENTADTEAIFITDDFEFHCSSGIGDTIPFEKSAN